jgi:hypothetical protein
MHKSSITSRCQTLISHEKIDAQKNMCGWTKFHIVPLSAFLRRLKKIPYYPTAPTLNSHYD